MYGGSVNPRNAADIINLPDVDGFYVGSRSLGPSIIEIVKTISKLREKRATAFQEGKEAYQRLQ